MMVLSDFVSKAFCNQGLNDPSYFAEVTVTVTTGALWWKKTHTSRRQIARDRFAGFWFFVDNGEHTLGFQAEDLERSFKAKSLAPSLTQSPYHHHQ